MSGLNAYQCNACDSVGPCFFFSDDTPDACPCQVLRSNWTLLVRGVPK